MNSLEQSPYNEAFSAARKIRHISDYQRIHDQVLRNTSLDHIQGQLNQYHEQRSFNFIHLFLSLMQLHLRLFLTLKYNLNWNQTALHVSAIRRFNSENCRTEWVLKLKYSSAFNPRRSLIHMHLFEIPALASCGVLVLLCFGWRYEYRCRLISLLRVKKNCVPPLVCFYAVALIQSMFLYF
jgi:hypothetical protein